MSAEKINVLQVSFVRGTYSVKMVEDDQYYWPLLDFDAAGRLVDGLCVCEEARCVHVKKALEVVTRGSLRLHQLFHRHFWHHLFYEMAQNSTPQPSDFEKSEDGWTFHSGKSYIRLEGSTPESVEAIQKFSESQPEYNERNSIKFSQLTDEETRQWSKGRPGPWLNYQLSVWSDLAHLLFMWGIDKNLSYCINLRFHQDMACLLIDADLFEIELMLEIEFLTHLFFYLHTLDKELVKSMRWQDNLQHLQPVGGDRFELVYTKHSAKIADEMKEYARLTPPNWSSGQWSYWSAKGLWKQSQNEWPSEFSLDEIVAYLENLENTQVLISGIEVNFDPVTPSYSVAFEEDGSMRLGPYLWQPDDLKSKAITLLSKGWVYNKERGFQKIAGEASVIEHLEATIVPKKKVGAYIDRHLDKLIQWAPFEVHTTALSRQIGYRVNTQKSVEFFDLLEAEEGFHGFGDWLYCPSQGLFHYKTQPLAIGSNTSVLWSELERFVLNHKQVLEEVRGFWAKESPLEKEYLRLNWQDKENRVGLEIEPYRIFKSGCLEKNVHWAGSLSYCEGVGFYHHSAAQIMPASLAKPLWISRSKFDEFWLANQASMIPYVEKWPSEFEPVVNYVLHVHTVLDTQPGFITFQADIKTKQGKTDLYQMLLGSKKTNYRFYPTPAGLIDLEGSLSKWKGDLSLTDEGALSIRSLDLLRLANLICLETSNEELRSFLTAQNENAARLPDISLLQSHLRGYQEIGVRWMWQLMRHGLGALLCDDMGLGKTHQVMALIAAVKKLEPNAPVLVVCPTSVLFHWYEKMQQFLPGVGVEIYHGSSRELPQTSLNVIVTSYGILRQDESLFKNSWQMVIMDEIQLAKNRRSQVWKACGRLRARYKIGMSGTPIENSLKDLKAIFDVIFPGYLPEDSIFRNEFVHAIEKYRDPEALERLKRWIHPLVLRRKKSEVLKELPEKVDETSHCVLSIEQQALYESVMQTSRDPILRALEDENQTIPYMHIFSVLNALKQICNHPACYWRNRDVPAKLESHQSSKWDLFTTLLHEALASGQKVVVFSQYLSQLDLIEEYLDSQKISYAGLRGQTRKRHEAVESFQKDPKCRVFVASLLAAGLGIDLTSGSVVILYDRWWNAARENQAVDRVHRIGQNRGVQVFRLVAVGTLEEKIDDMIQRKAKLLEEVTPVDDPSVLKRFSRNDLIEIFSADPKKERLMKLAQEPEEKS